MKLHYFDLVAIALWQRGEAVQAAGYVMGSVAVALLAFVVGMRLTRGLA